MIFFLGGLLLFCGPLKAEKTSSASDNGKSIQLPASYDYPMEKGPGYETVLKCRMCHSLGYILNQGKQSRSFWEHETQKMIAAYKAPITPEDATVIVNYLFTYYGNGKL